MRMAVLASNMKCQKLQADRKSTRLNSSHGYISYAVFCLKKKNNSLSAPYSYTLNVSVLGFQANDMSRLCSFPNVLLLNEVVLLFIRHLRPVLQRHFGRSD